MLFFKNAGLMHPSLTTIARASVLLCNLLTNTWDLLMYLHKRSDAFTARDKHIRRSHYEPVHTITHELQTIFSARI